MWIQQRRNFAQNVFDNLVGKCVSLFCVAFSPIQTLYLVGKDHSRYSSSCGDIHLENIALLLAGNGAEKGQADLAVVGSGREDDCRPSPGLLAPFLGIEVYVNHITAFGDIRS